MRLTSDVETSIVSVERVKGYTEIPQEAKSYIDQDKLPKVSRPFDV